MTKTKVVFIHTSAAAIGPLAAFYASEAPDLEIVNLLDDGLMAFFAADQSAAVEARLLQLVEGARDTYGIRAALLTCSAVEKPTLATLRRKSALPIVKIDEAMARDATRLGRRIGVIITFAPTVAPTRALLQEAAREASNPIELVQEVLPEAYEALRTGDAAGHDEAIVGAAKRLAAAGVDVVVLAQVSMSRVLGRLEQELAIPVLSSLRTSLQDLRSTMAAKQGDQT